MEDLSDNPVDIFISHLEENLSYRDEYRNIYNILASYEADDYYSARSRRLRRELSVCLENIQACRLRILEFLSNVIEISEEVANIISIELNLLEEWKINFDENFPEDAYELRLNELLDNFKNSSPFQESAPISI